MSLRNEWTFHYTASKVAAAAAEKLAYHDGRRTWWEAERDRVVAELRESGLEITEFEITGGQRAHVQFDPKLMERLSEAQSKIKRHLTEGDRYDMFRRALLGDPLQVLELHPDDIEYFGVDALTESEEKAGG